MEKPQFKVGDKVIVIDGYPGYKVGDICTLTKESHPYYFQTDHITCRKQGIGIQTRCISIYSKLHKALE